jgi:hypothetical protein
MEGAAGHRVQNGSGDTKQALRSVAVHGGGDLASYLRRNPRCGRRPSGERVRDSSAGNCNAVKMPPSLCVLVRLLPSALSPAPRMRLSPSLFFVSFLCAVAQSPRAQTGAPVGQIGRPDGTVNDEAIGARASAEADARDGHSSNRSLSPGARPRAMVAATTFFPTGTVHLFDRSGRDPQLQHGTRQRCCTGIGSLSSPDGPLATGVRRHAREGQLADNGSLMGLQRVATSASGRATAGDSTSRGRVSTVDQSLRSDTTERAATPQTTAADRPGVKNVLGLLFAGLSPQAFDDGRYEGERLVVRECPAHSARRRGRALTWRRPLAAPTRSE